MTRTLTAIFPAAALATPVACGATPTAGTVAPGDWQASTAQADTSTGRVPNLFGSGN